MISGSLDLDRKIVAALVLDEHPMCQHLILWSDSCMPQNKNSLMSLALHLQRRDLISIIQHFCEPGHSSIQDIVSVHSMTERAIRPHEILSPLSLVRHIKDICPNKQSMDITLLSKKQITPSRNVPNTNK